MATTWINQWETKAPVDEIKEWMKFGEQRGGTQGRVAVEMRSVDSRWHVQQVMDFGGSFG